MFNNKKIFVVVTLLYILYTVFPLFADIISIPVWLPSIASVLVIVLLYPNAFKNKLFYWFLVYAAVLTTYVLTGRDLTIGIGTVDDEKKIFIEFAFVLPAIAIFCVLYYLKDEQVNRRVAIWSMVILYFSFIVAVPLMQRYGSLRDAIDTGWAEKTKIPGLPGYALMHAYTLFLPVMCYAVKYFKGWRKWIALLGLFVLCYVVYDTFVTTSLLIMIGILSISLVYTGKNPGVFWFVVLLGFLILYTLYLMGFFITLIDWILPTFEGTPVAVKLHDIRDSMTMGELTGGSLVERRSLHRKSWKSFMSNPLLGGGEVGNHSSILDRFGGMGIIGGIPYIMLFITYIKQTKSLFQTQSAKVFWWIGLVAGAFFLYQKGIWGAEGWLFMMILLPNGILLFENKGVHGKAASS